MGEPKMRYIDWDDVEDVLAELGGVTHAGTGLDSDTLCGIDPDWAPQMLVLDINHPDGPRQAHRVTCEGCRAVLFSEGGLSTENVRSE
jgi:hypothetical protein